MKLFLLSISLVFVLVWLVLILARMLLMRLLWWILEFSDIVEFWWIEEVISVIFGGYMGGFYFVIIIRVGLNWLRWGFIFEVIFLFWVRVRWMWVLFCMLLAWRVLKSVVLIFLLEGIFWKVIVWVEFWRCFRCLFREKIWLLYIWMFFYIVLLFCIVLLKIEIFVFFLGYSFLLM